MPILNIRLDPEQMAQVRSSDYQATPADIFGQLAGVAGHFITVNIQEAEFQDGNCYAAQVELVLPDLLLPAARKRMLQAAVDMLQPAFGIEPDQAIATLALMPSGHVLDRGTLQEWEDEPPGPPGMVGG